MRKIKKWIKGLKGPVSPNVPPIVALVENFHCMKIADDIRRLTCASHLRIFRVPEEAEEPSPGMTSLGAVLR